MATDNTFYINAVTFAAATAVYTDPALTTLAADGFYQAPIEGVATYRELTGGVLAAAANCTCAVSQVLEFNTTPSDLCCISQTGVTYFIDQGTTFDTTTGLYTDATGQTKAPDDTYRVSGTNTFRVQSGGTLAAVASCPTCPVSCGEITIPSGGKGSYSLNVTLGTDVGSVVVYFNPATVPDGVRGVYDSTSYNALASPTNGYIKTTSGVANAFTIIGNGADACLPSTPNTTLYNFYDAIVSNAWVQNGTESVTINTGDVQGGGSNEYSSLVIPKPNANPQTMDLKALGPCTGTVFGLEIVCPAALPSWSTSTIAQNGSSASACAGSGATGFFAKQYTDRNNAGVVLPILHNWVFSDNTGATVLPNGFYKITATTVAQVANGVVTAITTCASSSSYSSSTIQSTTALACSSTANQTYYHSGSGALPASGEFVYSDAALTTVLGNGFYKLNTTSFLEVTSGTGLVSGPSSFAFATAFSTSTSQGNSAGACGSSLTMTLYHNGGAALPVVNDVVYQDPCKSTIIGNGYRLISTAGNGTYMYITGGTGVVSAVTSCPSITSYDSSTVNVSVLIACSSTVNQTYYHSGSGALPASGDTAWSDSGATTILTNGYYKLSATSFLEVTSGTGLVSGPSSFAFQTAWSGGLLDSNGNTACGFALNQNYFTNDATGGMATGDPSPRISDLVYSDACGNNPLPAGFYNSATNDAGQTYTDILEVASSPAGEVVDLIKCTPTTSYTSGAKQTSVILACPTTVNLPYFHSGASALPVVTNFVYSDNFGQTTLGAGFYKLTGTTYIQVNAAGAVTLVGTFSLGTSWSSSVVAADINAACALSTSTTFTHDNNSGDPIVNDACYTDACKTTALANGFYKTSNNTVVSITGGAGNVVAVTACVTYYPFSVHEVANTTLACTYSGTLDETIYTTIATGPAPNIVIYSDQSGTVVPAGVYVNQVTGTNAYFSTNATSVDSNGVVSCP